MLPAPKPADEQARLAALARYQIVDTAPEPEFDALVEIAARLLNVPIVLVSIVDADRQWFKARYGIKTLETPRDPAFCSYVVFEQAPLVIADALADPRFADNPLVVGPPHIRAYAGVPLRTPQGFTLGALCAVDHVPRGFSDEYVRLLQLLAVQVMTLLTLRRRTIEFHQAETERDRLTQEIVTVMDHMPALIGYWDKDLRNRHANQAYYDWFGVAPGTLRGKHIREVVGEFMYQANLPHMEAALRGEAQVFYRDAERPDGRMYYSQASYVPDISDGEVRGFFVLFTDISDRRIAEKALVAEKETARITLSALTEAVITADAAGRVVYLNPVAEQMTGWTLAAAQGQPLVAVLALRAFSGEFDAEQLREAVAGQAQATAKRTAWLLRRDGSQVAVEYSLSSLHGPEGQALGAVVVAHDVSEARALAIRMVRLAHHDSLTGLPNRLLLYDRLEQAVEDARRAKTRFAVLFLDLDEFKGLSAEIGEAAADEVVRAVAHRLRASVRGSDTAGRMGGDEFAVLLADVADKAAAALQAGQLLDALREPLHIAGRTVSVSFSLGLSVYPDDETDGEALLHQAESAMHAAKQAGRNCLRVFGDPMNG